MIVHYHEPNSLGRAKLRRLTQAGKLTLADIAAKIGYTRAAVSFAASGRPVGNKLIAALSKLTEGAISEDDWRTPYRGQADEIEMFTRFGPVPSGEIGDGPRRRLMKEALEKLEAVQERGQRGRAARRMKQQKPRTPTRSKP